MDNIYITTAHTGYNYGTYLQAYSMKVFLSEFASKSEIIWEKSFGPKGRDYRFKKIATVLTRTLIHYQRFNEIRQGYSKNFAAEPSFKTKELFDNFSTNYLDVKEYSLHELKKIAADDGTKAVVCGSDQIWNSSTMYPDPLYYLQFAPIEKRIAYAPSFGRDKVPEYNLNKIKTFVNSIPHLSVREDSGAEIIRDLTGRSAPVVPDPTMVIDWGDWISDDKEDSMLLYFLDEPSEEVINEIRFIQQQTGLRIKVLLHLFKSFETLSDIELIDAGPKEFVEIISKSRFVCTDSFHSTIFSIICKVPFFTYGRNYGKVASQGGRLITLLNRYQLESRFRQTLGDLSPHSIECDMGHVDEILLNDRLFAHSYMRKSLNLD